ncbi:MAG: MBL fold metallo-hydrolase [Cytophagaceae bacterium]|nr:MBL fold metallo-hydrolase [Gemmatimonadaceae bacterium]
MHDTNARLDACTRYACLVLSLMLALPLQAQSGRGSPPDFRLQEVVPGVFATLEPREWALSPMVHGNSVFVVNERDVLAVDANRTPAAARRTLDLLRGVTSNPIRWLLVTHWHGDHWLGVQAFREAFPALQVIATDTARQAMFPMLIEPFRIRQPAWYSTTADRYDSLFNAGVDVAGRPLTPARRKTSDMVRNAFRHYYAAEAQGMRLAAPDLTFRDSIRLHSGKRIIDLLFVGNGDTPGDAVAWLPAERVLAAGDMLVHPVPYAGSQVPSQWAKSLRSLRALDPLHIVPGHGEVQRGTAYLDLVIATIEATVAQVRRLQAEGASLEEVTKTVTMEAFRGRMVPANDAAVADRWDDFLGALIPNAYAEAASRTGS